MEKQISAFTSPILVLNGVTHSSIFSQGEPNTSIATASADAVRNSSPAGHDPMNRPVDAVHAPTHLEAA